MLDDVEKALRLQHREEISAKIQELSRLLAMAQDYNEAFKLISLKRKYDSESSCILDVESSDKTK